MKLSSMRVSGCLLVGVLLLAGCHSSQKEAAQSGQNGQNAKTVNPPVKLASPTPIDGGAHTFVPYADKPPLGTPVETH